ncbi:uncharacterized protein FYW35_005467 isoform 1-T2 [Pterocles gutturalis]
MKMYKMISMFILLFTGYLCTNMDVAAEDTTLTDSPSPASEVTQAPGMKIPIETAAPKSNHVPEQHSSALIVAGISISFVLVSVLVISGVCYARKKSERNSDEISSVPSGEPGVSLKRFQHMRTSASGLSKDHNDSGRAAA